MRHGASRDRPFRDHGTFFEINCFRLAFSAYNVSHCYVHSFSRWLERDAGWITAWQFYGAHQFGGPRVHDFNGSVRSDVSAAATHLDMISRNEGFHASVKQMGARIIDGIVGSAVRVTVGGQFDGLGYLVRGPADGRHTAIG